MDTEEVKKVEEIENIKEAGNPEELEKQRESESIKEPENPEARKRKGKAGIIIGCLLAGIAAIGAGAYIIVYNLSPKGYRDYTVQKEFYFVEYSDEYDYWDVLTIEYPRLDGIDGEQIEQINKAMYDRAMDRTNYWHLEPDEEVRKVQEEYSIFCSDVQCEVVYHSQYLLSVDYFEIYAPVSPVYYTNMTERAINIDLMTGEVYGLTDIFTINEDFIKLWCSAAHKEYGDVIEDDEETREIMLMWFLGEDEELEEYYEIRPFFIITQDKELEVGIAIDPKLHGLTYGEPNANIYSTVLTAEELEPYRAESGFWDKYEKSESTGEVIECEDRKENIWLGETAGVWDYWEER